MTDFWVLLFISWGHKQQRQTEVVLLVTQVDKSVFLHLTVTAQSSSVIWAEALSQCSGRTRRPWAQPVRGLLRTRRSGQAICQSWGIRDRRPSVNSGRGGWVRGGRGKCSHVKGIIWEQSEGSTVGWRDYISLRRDTNRSLCFDEWRVFLRSSKVFRFLKVSTTAAFLTRF